MKCPQCSEEMGNLIRCPVCRWKKGEENESQ
jgi:hypothetical protein